MPRMVLLDTGVLSEAIHPKDDPEFNSWFRALIAQGDLARVPEIADYELRRELIRVNKVQSIARLDNLSVAIQNRRSKGRPAPRLVPGHECAHEMD